MWKIFSILIIFHSQNIGIDAISYGIIHNASLLLFGANPPRIITGTCDDCLCQLLTNTTIFSFNCFPFNQTCQIYSTLDQSQSFRMIDDSFSQFYFLSLPLGLIASTSNPLQSIAAAPINVTTTATLTLAAVYLWTYDSTYNDLSSTFIGTPINNLSFSSSSITGNGSSLSLSSSSSQYVLYASPLLNLANQSWTFEAWIYLQSIVNGSDYGIIGQCENKTLNKCLHLIVRAQKLYFGFYSNDLPGQTDLLPSTWYHVAFVFNCTTRNRSLYLNGQIDATDVSPVCYQGAGRALTVGTVTSSSIFHQYFNGYIDQLSYTNRAKTSSEILDDGTLTLYFSFDNGSTFDQGPLHINGSRYGLTNFTSGQVGSALQIVNSSYSYFLVSGLVLLGVSGQAYSFSLWIRPDRVQQGSIIYVSSTISARSGWCVSMLGLTSSGYLMTYSLESFNLVSTKGPIIPINSWTHAAITYGSSNGLKLYINGTLRNSSSPFSYSASGAENDVFIGSSLSSWLCATTSSVDGQYSGAVDEFRLYSREFVDCLIEAIMSPSISLGRCEKTHREQTLFSS